jgi:peptide/nickel transport system permease protein
MRRLLARKALSAVVLAWAVLTLTWLLIELSPGDASAAFVTQDMKPEVVANIRAAWHVGGPWHARYLALLRNVATGDFGWSIVQSRPVTRMIGDALPYTMLLASVSLLAAHLVGGLVGVVQALRRHGPVDLALSVASVVAWSVPGFWLALLLQLVFCLLWPVLPSSGALDPVTYDYAGALDQLADRARHLVLPGLALGLAASAESARFMRGAMLEVLSQDYIRTARAKGLPERVVILKHALRNALIPTITLVGLQLPALFGGAVIVETVFAWPGMGRLIVTAVRQQDTPVIAAVFTVMTGVVVLGGLLADLLYAAADPRVRVT